MSFRSRLRGSLLYAVAIVSGFLLAYLIVAFVIFPSGVITGDAKVPNVTGLLFDDATMRLAEVGFKSAHGESRFHAASPKETVLEQSPPAGTRDVEGTTVTLVTSAGQQIATVPAIVGMTQADAQAALEGAGYELGQVTEKPSSAARGQVIASTPTPGSKATIPSAVAVIVSEGSDVVLVPDVVGRNLADAQRLLQQATLTASDLAGPQGGTASQGTTVASQTPAAGAQVAAGSRVDLYLTAPGGGRPQ